jgi:hypothetical protein
LSIGILIRRKWPGWITLLIIGHFVAFFKERFIFLEEMLFEFGLCKSSRLLLFPGCFLVRSPSIGPTLW